MFLAVLSLLFLFFSFSSLALLGFSVWTKLVIFLLMMSLFAVNTSQFSFRNARMISIGRGIHPSWLGVIRLLAQFLLPRGYSSFFLHLVSHPPPPPSPASLDELLNPSLRSIFMFLKAFLTRQLNRNLGNTLNHLEMTLRGTARTVSSPTPH